MSWGKQLTLAGVVLFGAFGDVALSRGMKSMGGIRLNHLQLLLVAMLNPWIVLGVLVLLAFFASYLTALSFADLTYVLPATSVGYILMALMARFFLQEQVSATRWMGISLIAAGVGFVTRGPSHTPPPVPEPAEVEQVR